VPTADSIAPTAPIQHVGLVLSRRAEAPAVSRFHLDRVPFGYFSSCSARPLIFSPRFPFEKSKNCSRFERGGLMKRIALKLSLSYLLPCRWPRRNLVFLRKFRRACRGCANAVVGRQGTHAYRAKVELLRRRGAVNARSAIQHPRADAKLLLASSRVEREWCPRAGPGRDCRGSANLRPVAAPAPAQTAQTQTFGEPLPTQSS